ncbi:ABC transporter ATP-binding protein [Ferroglobus sp.]|uniref:ABC transporter ATP-binding protein n=1 Tax=Ferroglobus sp. TaxID=2614230 RepID=UPI0025C65C80|nr:ABC transporter ATP-binding protein [Ferroglobus sp.]
MFAIEVVDLKKNFGKTVALNGLTFRVDYGEVYALLGPNGAGKSTTLKILVGLLKPDGGVAKIDGVDVKNRAEVMKKIGYIPEEPVLFPYLTAKEVLVYSAKLRGLKDCEDRIEYLLNIFSLEGDKIVAGMSKGMVQKLAACVAFLHEPEILIMDEPMANMDPESQHVFKKEIRRMKATALISTHQLAEVEKFCDRVGVISKGKLVAEASIREIDELERFFLEVAK